MSLLSLASAQEPQHPSPDGANGVRPAPRTMPQGRDEIPAVIDAQRTATAVPGDDSAIPIHTQDADPVGGEYGTWAAGGKYKVSFHGDMTFIPYLGSGYPHNQPFSWQTTSVRIGEEELLGTGEVPARGNSDFQYRYRYGRFTEVYDVRTEGLEQSFVIDRPVGAGGDLVVEGRLGTALHGEAVTGTHQAIRFFDDEQREILTYGEAYAIDSSGRKTGITSTLAGDRIQLRVDAQWLAGAAYPVTIDPILTPVRIDWGTARESVDMCRDDTANDRMYTFIRAVSATDKDVYARILEDDYSTGTYVFSDLGTGWSHRQTRVAAIGAPQKYAVVYDRDFTAGTSAIRYHIHDSGDLTPSSTVSFFTYTSTMQDWRADVGGGLLGAGTEFMIAYQRDAGSPLANTANSEIWAATIDVSGASPVNGARFQLAQWSAGTDIDMERPSINKQATPSSNMVWMVVWQEYWNNHPNPVDDWDACGRLVDASGSASASVWVTLGEGSQTHHQLGPIVAGAAGRYCVTYAACDMTLANFKTTVINGSSVNAERVNWSSLTTSPQRFNDHLLWGQHADRRWRVGGIAYDSNSDSHWALTSLSDTVYSGTGNVYMDRVGYNGAGLESVTLYSAPTNFNGDPGGVVFDDDNIEMATAWIQNDTTVSPTTGGIGAHDIFATSFSYPTPSSSPAMSGTTCGTGTLIWSPSAISSGQQIGSEFSQVNINGLPSGALSFVGVSLQAANVLTIGVPIAPNCRLLISNTSGFLGYFPLIIGTSGSARLSLPEWLPSMNLYFQDWYINPATNLVYSTQRLTVPITK